MMYRAPAVAGKFYPADPEELHRNIGEMIAQVPEFQPDEKIKGIIAPHAGYLYSGFTAAHAYAALAGKKFETVVVVSPSHWQFFPGVSVYPGDAYTTPLGAIRINKKLRDELTVQEDFIVASEAGHQKEHALEVQLPFLQEVLPPFTLLPLVIGDQSRAVCFELGKALARIVEKENALLVASTDLSHYHQASVANKLDEIFLKDVTDFDFERLMSDLETKHTEACGGGPVVAVMAALNQLGIQKIRVLHHSNSGDVTGDYSSVVGYFSAVAFA